MSRRALLILASVVSLPWILLGAWLLWSKWPGPRKASVADQFSEANTRVSMSRPGPWGSLEFTRIAVEPPEEFIFANEPQEDPNWFFKGLRKADIQALLSEVKLTPAQREALFVKSPWEESPEGVRARPSADLVLELPGPARELIYNLLARFPENRPQNTAFSFNPNFLKERLELSGLTQTTLDLFQRLLYRHGEILLFADMNLVLPRLPDQMERVRFVKTLSRKTTVLGKLLVTPDTDVDKIVSYWGFDGRAKDLRPLIESLKRVPEGTKLDLAHLLPPFARRRLYTFPVPSEDPLAARRDCHWTSLNFFSEQPDDRFTDQQVAVKAIGDNYYQIAGGARLGDLVLVMTQESKVVHSAVYVADDIVFTKNGPMFTQPWMLMRMEHMLEYYSAFYPPNEPLRIRFYRQKELAPVLKSNP